MTIKSFDGADGNNPLNSPMKYSKITKNSLYVFSARAIEAISGLIIMIMVARSLGVELFGKYSLILAIVWVLSPFLTLRSAPHIIVREIAKDINTAPQIIGSSIFLSTMMVIPVALAAYVIVMLLHLDSASLIAIFIAISFFLVKTWISQLTAIYIAIEKMKYEAIVALSVCIFELIFTAFVYFMHLGLVAFFIAIAIANLFGLTIIIFLVKRLHIKYRGGRIRYLFLEIIPLSISRLFTQGFLYVDVFILKLLTDNIQVGLFQASQRIVTRLLILPVSINMSIFPLFARLAAEPTKKELKKEFDKWFKLILFVSLLITFFGSSLSGEIVHILYGDVFSQVTPSLSVLFFAVPFLFVGQLSQNINIACGRQKFVMIAEGLCLSANLILDIVLIPKYGYMGASWATLSGCIVIFVANLSFMPRALISFKTFTVILKFIIASASALLLHNSMLPLSKVLAILGSIVIYIAILFITNTFSIRELQNLFKLVLLKLHHQKTR